MEDSNLYEELRNRIYVKREHKIIEVILISLMVIVSIIVLSLIAFVTTAFASIDSNLKYGMKGSSVTELQEFLITKGFLQVQATGNFYSLTLKAVKDFQSANDIPNTGYVGVLTRTEINKQLNAEVASSTIDEISEIGTTTLVVSTSTDIDNSAQIISELQKQNQLLQQQIQTTINVGVSKVVQNYPLPTMNLRLPPPYATTTYNGMIYYIDVGQGATKGIAKVECYIDNIYFWSITNDNLNSDDTVLLALNGGQSNSVNLDTTKYLNGQHKISCKIWNHNGDMAQSSVLLDIENN